MCHRASGLLRQLVLLLGCWCAMRARAQETDKQLRQEVGLQSCIDGFVVHRDKIIRTQDSRDMGAKYLTEIDVESRLECMKGCCETEQCDVFIFEEKKPGSCYLFHCGPPHDFKCKFTSHANYSSAVLTNYNLQSAAVLEEQIRRNQQEHELKSLRKSEQPPKEYKYFIDAPVSSSTTSVPILTTTSTTQAPVKISKCSRNQFGCHSNDECIAIYNVCDGIPQCADGSDEAAELDCPIDRSTIPPQPPPPPPVLASTKPYIPVLPDVLRYQQMLQQQQQQHNQYPMAYASEHGQEVSKGWVMTNPNLHEGIYNNRAGGYILQQQQQHMQQSPEDMVLPTGMAQLLPVNYKPSSYQWNNYPAPIYGEANAFKINNNVALDAMHAQNSLPPGYERLATVGIIYLDDKNSAKKGLSNLVTQSSDNQQPHIFNHKGPGIRLEEMEAVNGIYGQDPNGGYAPYYPSMIHHSDSWQGGNPSIQATPVPIVSQAPPHKHIIEEPNKNSTTSTSAPPCVPSDKTNDSSKKQNIINERKLENDETHQKLYSSVTKTSIKNNNSLSESHESKPEPEKIIQTDNHKAHEAELRTMAEAHLQEHKSLAISDHIRRHGTKLEDLEMTRPKGAVISLVLGLTVTVVMAVLIACRLRVVKRRGRGRGHDSYAQDSDYLVNGMYL